MVAKKSKLVIRKKTPEHKYFVNFFEFSGNKKILFTIINSQ